MAFWKEEYRIKEYLNVYSVEKRKLVAKPGRFWQLFNRLMPWEEITKQNKPLFFNSLADANKVAGAFKKGIVYHEVSNGNAVLGSA